MANPADFIADSKKFFDLLRLMVPIFPQDGHFDVSGKDLKNILSCNTN
ncbi:MAG: hypothetical protein IT281_01325 [Ignavibacteria bacterium]|nr:hypothetical protein [Ignavibacteria bacterium]